MAFANLARMVVERSALTVMETVQRGIGLRAFVRPHDVERICRDLATYLRQPVPDRAMSEWGSGLSEFVAVGRRLLVKVSEYLRSDEGASYHLARGR